MAPGIVDRRAAFAIRSHRPDRDRTTELRITSGATIRNLTDLQNEWTAREKDLGIWREQITKRASVVSADAAKIDALRTRWKATRVAACPVGAITP